jgi:hypothetical protein
VIRLLCCLAAALVLLSAATVAAPAVEATVPAAAADPVSAPAPAPAADPAPAPASAQSPYRKELAILGRIAPGDMLRLEGAGLQRFEGRFLGSVADTLVVTRGSLETRVPLTAVDGAWARRPALRSRAVKGARIGAKVGAITGGLGYLLLLDKRFNDPPDDYSLGWHIAFVVEEAFFFGAVGTVIGAAAGVDRTTWQPLWEAPAKRPAPAIASAVPRSIHTGEAAFHAGVAQGIAGCTSGRSPYVGAHMYATPWRRFAFGPEIGWAPRGLHQPADAHSGSGAAFHAVLGGRFTPWPSARLCPAFTLTSGFYSWSEQYVGASAGVGLRVDRGSARRPVEMSLAWHEPLQVPVKACDYRFLTASLGVRFAAW